MNDCRPVARFFYGEVRSKEEADQRRPEEHVYGCVCVGGWVGGCWGGVGELGGLRLYYKCFEKHGYFSKFGPSKLIIFCKETTLLLSVRRWMCIRGELLLCREYSFLPQKTAYNLNYSQRQRGAQKTNNAYLHLLQVHMNPRSTLRNWLFNRQFKNENSHSLKQPDKCVQLETAVPLSPKSKNKKKLGQACQNYSRESHTLSYC